MRSSMQISFLEEWVSSFLPDIKKVRSTKRITGFAIDSRNVLPGDLFFALLGERVDGHSFLKQAAEAGAVAAIVSSEYSGPHFGLELIYVDAPVESLQTAARNKFDSLEGTVIGITGSVGKTTTKQFLNTMLAPFYKVYASPKSYNSQLTVPLSVLMTEGDEDYVLLEMGISQPGDMQNLIEIVEPEISVITNVYEQHLNHFESLDAIAKEKAHILTMSQVQLLPKDIKYYDYLKNVSPHAELFTFALHNETADFYFHAITKENVLIRTPDDIVDIPIHFPYQPAYHNFLISFALAWILGLPLDDIIETIPSLSLPNMRFERNCINGITFINDAYNACPQAMLEALKALPLPDPGGKIVMVLGHMVDLGAYTYEGHAIVAAAALEKANIIFFVGEHWAPIKQLYENSFCKIEFYQNVDDLAVCLPQSLNQGDVVLLKGSRLLSLEQVLNFL